LAQRLAQIATEISRTGTYTLTTDELHFGVKNAWRNASRCIGRIQWNKLELQDARHVRNTKEMFEALCKHIQYATNNGNIRFNFKFDLLFHKSIFPNNKIKISVI
jgi:nitric oxide synthase oxygenase domain/subunit